MTRRPRDQLVPPETPAMDAKAAAAEPAINCDDPRQTNVTQADSLLQVDNARPRNTLHQCLSVWHAGGKGVESPATCSGQPTNTG